MPYDRPSSNDGDADLGEIQTPTRGERREAELVTLRPDQTAKLSDTVYDALRDAIVTAKLRPGARLYPVQLAEQLQVSPTPVKDALQRLAGERLVEIRPRRGAVVSRPSIATISEVFAVRRALECLAVEEALDRSHSRDAWPAELRVLRRLARRVAETRDGESAEHVTANFSFHERLVILSNNSILRELYSQLQVRMLVSRLHEGLPAWRERLAAEAAEHATIVDCLERGDRSGVVAALSEHIGAARQRAVDDAIRRGWGADPRSDPE